MGDDSEPGAEKEHSNKVTTDNPEKSDPVQDTATMENSQHVDEAQDVLQDRLTDEDIGLTGERPKTPTVSDIRFLSRTHWPKSYQSNTLKEQHLYEHVDRFVTQFRRLYPDRKAQFICPSNDCQFPKLASTYLRPTMLPYEECYDWEGCAQFVADHLDYRPLGDPTSIPHSMHAPAEVLRYQSGNAFEYSNILCSLMIGVNYNAYVVSGYAVRPVCLRETIRIACERDAGKKKGEFQEPVCTNIIDYDRKYVSRYEKMMFDRAREAVRQTKQAEKDEMLRRMSDQEKEESDLLFGRRVHSWVLVLPGSRDVQEAFFIEPTIGRAKKIRTADYLGIESMWNHRNYWINMQLCLNGVRDLEYDLYNPAHWEFLLLGEAMRTPHPQQTKTMLEEDIVEADSLLEMPPSWVERLEVSRPKFHERYPCGHKTTMYYRIKLDEYAPYSTENGIIKRKTLYEDFGNTKPITVEEVYHNRSDHLVKREVTPRTGWVFEQFEAGREDRLKEHRYCLLKNGPEDNRTMLYYHKARKMGLSRRLVNDAGVINEDFEERPDKLYRREIKLGVAQKKNEQETNQRGSVVQRGDPTGANERRTIIDITERLYPCRRKDNTRCASRRTFNLEESKITVLFHPATGQIVQERRQFVKPQLHDGASLVSALGDAASSNSAAAYPPPKPARLLDMYGTLKDMLQLEQQAITDVHDAQAEVANLLAIRALEEANVAVSYDLFDSDLSPTIRNDRKALEEHRAAEARRLMEESKDPLAAFLRELGTKAEDLTPAQRTQLREDCLANFRQRLVSKAGRIHNKFVRATEELQSRQSWYQEHRQSVSQKEEQEYVTACHQIMRRLQTLEQLLQSHKYIAPLRFEALKTQLDNDPRIAVHI